MRTIILFFTIALPISAIADESVSISKEDGYELRAIEAEIENLQLHANPLIQRRAEVLKKYHLAWTPRGYVKDEAPKPAAKVEAPKPDAKKEKAK